MKDFIRVLIIEYRMKLTNNYQFNVSTNTWQVSFLGVPVPVGLYAYSFLLRLYHFSSVSPHVENCIWLLSAAKRLSLQSLTLSTNWHPCQFVDDEFLLCKNSLLSGTTAIHGGYECTSLYIAQRQVFAQYCHGGQVYWAETMFAFANSQVNLQHGRCKLMQLASA